jgi:hypothetical protein
MSGWPSPVSQDVDAAMEKEKDLTDLYPIRKVNHWLTIRYTKVNIHKVNLFTVEHARAH